MSPLRLQPLESEDPCSIIVWFEKVKEIRQTEVHAMFAAIAWSTWYARNLLVFQGKELTHGDCLNVAQRAIWTITPVCSPTQSHPPRLMVSRDGQMKVSCDAALRDGKGSGFGCVLHNVDDVFLGCRYGFRSGAYTCLEDEAMAVFEGIQLCVEQGIRDVIIETDNQTLFWMLHKRDSDLSYLGDTLKKFFEAVDTIPLVAFSWTPREGNAMADRIASFAIDNSVLPVSSSSLPAVLNSLLVE
ncbi:uncharacterized protein LOC131009676 [Salvia miltiorrhiza]|uniref:uncharacterized protein LOC131009676 n=1 Tax=Salvia miltiorrhiza TaxID=226208 RepID=UPI0025AC7D05|nr:uncharacterized protein LOC131009676 [Salvia miltiorrhiza]